MSIKAEDVKKIAQLAHLSIDEDKLTNYSNEMSKILTFVEQINQVGNLDQIRPLAHPNAQKQRLRIDTVDEMKHEPAKQRDLFQQNAPAIEAGLYLVPKVVDKNV